MKDSRKIELQMSKCPPLKKMKIAIKQVAVIKFTAFIVQLNGDLPPLDERSFLIKIKTFIGRSL